jgi:hypothetical protein
VIVPKFAKSKDPRTRKQPVGHRRVQVGVEVQILAEGMNGHDDAGNVENVVTEGNVINRPSSFKIAHHFSPHPVTRYQPSAYVERTELGNVMQAFLTEFQHFID